MAGPLRQLQLTILHDPADLVEDCVQTARDMDPAVQSIADTLTEARAALEAIRGRPHTVEELAPIQVRVGCRLGETASRIASSIRKHW